MADINKIKLPSGAEYNIKDYRIPGVDTTPTSGSDNVVTSGGIHNSIKDFESFYFVQGSSSAAGNSTSGSYLSTKWEGTVPGVSTATNGLKIAYRIATNTGVSTAGVVLSIDGTNYYPVVIQKNTLVTTHYPVGTTVLMVFNSTQTASAYLTSNTKTTVTGCWQIMEYDSNTNTYQRLYASTGNTEYPITARYNTTSGESYYAEYGRYSGGVTLNPSTNTITASSFKKTGGTSSQFLKADGSVDSNSYATTSNLEDVRDLVCPAVSGAVDLGLSVLWSTTNLGASTEYDLGDLYSWGEVETKNEYTSNNYSPVYSTLQEIGEPLIPEADAATQVLGNGWRMPTKTEFQELLDNCTCQYYSTLNPNRKYWTITSNINGASMIIPASSYPEYLTSTYGYYKISAYSSGNRADIFDFPEGTSTDPHVDYTYFYVGNYIRPVHENTNRFNNYYTKTETDTLLSAKQNTLVSGTSIKTINNESLLGSGNITISGGTLITNATTAQTASSGEAMSSNITLHKIAKTGTYSDLIGKPTVDSSPTSNSSNLVSSGGVYSAINTAIGSVYRVKGTKADYASLPSSGNVAGDVWNVTAAYNNYPAGTNWVWTGSAWDALGGAIDLSGKQDVLTFDSTPTANSTNPVTSGGIYTAVESARELVCLEYTAQILRPSEIQASDLPGAYTAAIAALNAGKIPYLKINCASDNTFYFYLEARRMYSSYLPFFTIHNLPSSYGDECYSYYIRLNSDSSISAGDISLVQRINIDSTPTEYSNNAVSSGGVYDVIVENEEITSAALNTFNDRLIEVEEGLSNVNVEETDPIFTSSPAYNITSANITSWNNKVSNVQSDWNATSGNAVILNKPDLSDYLTVSQYRDDEIVIASAFNDLNDRMDVVEDKEWVTSEPYSQIDSVVRDTYTKSEIDTMLSNIGGGGSGSGSGGSGEQAVTSVTVSGSGNAVTNATFSNKALTLTKGNIATPGTLTTTSTTALSTASNEALSGSISLHKVAKTGTYSDLIGKPTIPAAPGTLNTTATTAQSTAASEALSGNITLHKVAKTGTYSDLIGTPTIPAAQVQSDWNATSGMGVILNKPTIPAAPGTLNTNNTTAQTVSSSEALSGTINLHKVAKTGSYNDLLNKPTIPTKVSDLTNDSGFTNNVGTVTGITINGDTKSPTSGIVDLGDVSCPWKDGTGTNSAVGYGSTASGERSMAFGYNSKANGNYSVGLGLSGKAFGQGSFAVGGTAVGQQTRSMSTATTTGTYPKLTGAANATTYTCDSLNNLKKGTILYYNNTYAYITNIQDLTITTNVTLSSSALNATSVNIVGGVAFGDHSSTNGYSCNAVGTYSTSEGMSSLSYGSSSHAEGSGTEAYGSSSHAEGSHTITNNEGEHAQGCWNVSNTGNTDANRTLHSIGLGYSSNRSNAVEVMKNGDVYIKGIGSYDGTNYSSASTLQSIVNNASGGSSGTLNTNNSTAQTVNSSESLAGTINLHKVAKTGTYSDLIGTPTIPTKVSDLTNDSGFTSNVGTITGITMNGASKGTSGVVDLGTVITSHAKHKLTTTNGTATSASGTITYVESLTGTTTATDGDLTLTATRKSITIPSAPGTLNTTATTAQSTAASEALSGSITLHKVAKTGTYSDLIGTPTIPTVNNSTISIQKGGTAVDSFTTNASSAKTINIPNELPSYSSSDSGKVLSVNSSGQLVWITPAQIYSGSGTPSNGTGNNGDIYLQS